MPKGPGARERSLVSIFGGGSMPGLSSCSLCDSIAGGGSFLLFAQNLTETSRLAQMERAFCERLANRRAATPAPIDGNEEEVVAVRDV